MKNIILWGKNINYESDIKMKHMRSMYPFLQEVESDSINAIVEISKIIFIDLEWDKDVKKYLDFLDDLSIPDMNKFMDFIWKIIAESSKKK